MDGLWSAHPLNVATMNTAIVWDIETVPDIKASLPPMVMMAGAMMKFASRDGRQVPQAHLPLDHLPRSSTLQN
jgi:hypothetical protein